MISVRELFGRKLGYVALGIIAAAFVLKAIYIFHFTSYQVSFHNDMGAYWYGAFDRAWGDRTVVSQWGGFAPFYKYYFLAPLFQLLDQVGLISYALPLVIFIFLFLHSLSAYVFYLVMVRLVSNKVLALAALVFYAFSYLATYLNATVLPENLATPLLVMAVGIMILTELELGWLVTAGCLLGIAVATKPLLAVFAPVMMWHIWSGKKEWARFVKVAVFFLAVAIAPLATMAENHRQSGGQFSGLAAIAGVNFWQGWGRVGLVHSTSPQGGGFFHSPGALDEPGWESVTTPEPWHHQGFFYAAGWQAIGQDPSVLVEKIGWFKKLFWGVLGPSHRYSPVGYHTLMPWVQNIFYGMFLSLGILYLFLMKHGDARAIRFLFALLGAFFVALYAVGLPERRYFINIEFLVIALFFIMASQMMTLYKVYKREIVVYCFVAGVFFFGFPLALGFLNGLLY